jgi:hypothetical protein
MKTPKITIDRKLKTATIVMALEKSHPSKSTGKTKLIASTRGVRTSDETYSHRPVCFTANVFFYPTNPVQTIKDHQANLTLEEGKHAQRTGRYSRSDGVPLKRLRRPDAVDIATSKTSRDSGTKE